MPQFVSVCSRVHCSWWSWESWCHLKVKLDTVAASPSRRRLPGSCRGPSETTSCLAWRMTSTATPLSSRPVSWRRYLPFRMFALLPSLPPNNLCFAAKVIFFCFFSVFSVFFLLWQLDLKLSFFSFNGLTLSGQLQSIRKVQVSTLTPIMSLTHTNLHTLSCSHQPVCWVTAPSAE